MKHPRAFHDFYAPIDGIAVKFCIGVCGNSGVPKAVFPQERGLKRVTLERCDLINKLLDGGVPWGAIRYSAGRGEIGAIIEAAEARRAEIYGQLPVAA